MRLWNKLVTTIIIIWTRCYSKTLIRVSTVLFTRKEFFSRQSKCPNMQTMMMMLQSWSTFLSGSKWQTCLWTKHLCIGCGLMFITLMTIPQSMTFAMLLRKNLALLRKYKWKRARRIKRGCNKCLISWTTYSESRLLSWCCYASSLWQHPWVLTYTTSPKKLGS